MKYMPRQYEKQLKQKIVTIIVDKKNSTKKTAEKYDIPLKTVEKWITAYNKDKNVFKEK